MGSSLARGAALLILLQSRLSSLALVVVPVAKDLLESSPVPVSTVVLHCLRFQFRFKPVSCSGSQRLSMSRLSSLLGLSVRLRLVFPCA